MSPIRIPGPRPRRTVSAPTRRTVSAPTRRTVSAPTRRTLLALLGGGVGAAALAACGGAGSSGAAEGSLPVVVVSCYPMEYLVHGIAGDEVEILQLATPGGDAHGAELSVQQVQQIRDAALVVQIPGLQTSLDDAIASQGIDTVLDVTASLTMLSADGEEHEEDGHDHEEGADDPHVWHDPVRMAEIADALTERLVAVLPDAEQALTDAAAALREELETLDAELAEAFGAVDGERAFITSHAAFGYLAERYDLHQVGIAGIDPETEPSPRRLLELEQVVEDEGVTTIFFEATASPDVARTLADNVGVEAAELDNLETRLSEEADYPQVMRENSRKLVESWS